jgi:DnaJ-class molecular chaperone
MCAAEAKKLELEEDCGACQGEGVVGGDICPVCRGDRVVLTDIGERLVEIIDKRIDARLRSALSRC